MAVACVSLRIFVADIEAEVFSKVVEYIVEKKRSEEFVYSQRIIILSAQN